MNRFYFAFLVCLLFTGCHEEQVIPVEIDVVFTVTDNDHTAPLTVWIKNNTIGAQEYLWLFDGGIPTRSTLQNPESVQFDEPGEHSILIEAWNAGRKASKSYTIRVDSTVHVDFSMEVEMNHFAPAEFKITNLSTGGSTYKWTFEGGNPDSFDGKNPPAILYPSAGTFPVLLTVTNGGATFECHKDVFVGDSLDISFSIEPSFEDEDMEAPLRATFNSSLKGVTDLIWSCNGAEITNPTSPEATIYFPKEGTYTVQLDATNGKETGQATQTITIKENTNLRTHRDIRLGINSSVQSYPVCYSTRLRKVFAFSEITETNVADIDIVYYGLNANFSYNQFVSPNALSQTSFREIPGTVFTKFINKTELGTPELSPTQFVSMTNDLPLRDLSILTAAHGEEPFGKEPLPRVVLFQTADGRKGAIYVKEMVASTREDSYILVDIKIQKND